MRLQPIVYTTDMAATAGWYGTVLGREPVYRSDMWIAFDVAGTTLGIHKVEHLPDRGRVEVSLVSEVPLEAVIERLSAAGIEPVEPVREQPFGRSVLLRDPDGSPVQVNEHNRG